MFKIRCNRKIRAGIDARWNCADFGVVMGSDGGGGGGGLRADAEV